MRAAHVEAIGPRAEKSVRPDMQRLIEMRTAPQNRGQLMTAKQFCCCKRNFKMSDGRN